MIGTVQVIALPYNNAFVVFTRFADSTSAGIEPAAFILPLGKNESAGTSTDKQDHLTVVTLSSNWFCCMPHFHGNDSLGPW